MMMFLGSLSGRLQLCKLVKAQAWQTYLVRNEQSEWILCSKKESYHSWKKSMLEQWIHKQRDNSSTIKPWNTKTVDARLTLSSRNSRASPVSTITRTSSSRRNTMRSLKLNQRSAWTSARILMITLHQSRHRCRKMWLNQEKRIMKS